MQAPSDYIEAFYVCGRQMPWEPARLKPCRAQARNLSDLDVGMVRFVLVFVKTRESLMIQEERLIYSFAVEYCQPNEVEIAFNAKPVPGQKFGPVRSEPVGLVTQH